MAAVFKDASRAPENQLVTLGPYRPWKWHTEIGGNRFDYPAFSGLILDLKDRKQRGIKHFTELLAPDLRGGFAIAHVPSSTATKTETGIRDLARAIALQNSCTDATECVVRHTTIPKAAKGGERSIEVHLGSLRIEKTSLVNGRDVLLLDDVTTSGCSLIASRQLLLKAGAKSVTMVALGRTDFS
jgi:predicted amidophosphoribosyltransferase